MMEIRDGSCRWEIRKKEEKKQVGGKADLRQHTAMVTADRLPQNVSQKRD
jgi:hypothetical protein